MKIIITKGLFLLTCGAMLFGETTFISRNTSFSNLKITPKYANDGDIIPYLSRSWDDTNKIIVENTLNCGTFTTVTSETTSWTSGWYIVDSDVTVSDRISVSGTVNLILCDGYTLTASKGIEVREDNGVTDTLNIYGQEEETGTVLVALSFTDTVNIDAAGIGSSKGYDGGNINIYSGTVDSTAIQYGAGIGSGYGGDTGNITIYGGNISASGGHEVFVTNCKGSDGSGIGGGRGGNVDEITIYGGNITASGGDHGGGSGIGAGTYDDVEFNKGGNGGTINIHGGTINSTGKGGAGIGAGNKGDGGVINITGGNITTIGSSNNSGLGGAYQGDGGIINISGGYVNATGGSGGPGIGVGYEGNNVEIHISGGKVIGTGTNYIQGIGGRKGTISIEITGGDVTGIGGSSGYAGIGGPSTGYGTLTIPNGYYLLGSDTESNLVYPDHEQTDWSTTRWRYMAVRLNHTHDWEYSANGASIIAQCNSENCPITDGLTLTIEGNESYTYTGSDLSFLISITSGYSEDAFDEPIIEYFKDDEEVTECINVGSYEARVTIGGETAVFPFEITKKNFVIGEDYVAPTAKTYLVYNGSNQKLINAGSTSNGTIQYKLDNGEYSTNIPSARNAGNYTVFYKIIGDSNHNDLEEQSISVSIEKTNTTLVSPRPKSNLVYTGNEQVLMESGTASGGVLQYKIGANGTYSTSVPTATDAGNYYIYFRVVGDNNHYDIDERGPMIATIAKDDCSFEIPTAKTNLVYSASPQQLVDPGISSGGTIQYKIGENGTYSANIPTATDAGSYDIYYRVVGDNNHNDIDEAGPINVTIAKTECIFEEPTAKIDLVYNGENQNLINAGTVDYVNVLYALNLSDSLPNDSEFSINIPQGKDVGIYYVFYKTEGDNNHTEISASIDNKVVVEISRVDRTNAINVNNKVNDYLETIEEDYTDIANELETERSIFEEEVINEDNITLEEINSRIDDLENSLSEAKVDVTETMISEITSITYPDSKELIDKAKNYYENILNAEEKEMVDSSIKDILFSSYENFYAADNVIELIDTIPEVNPNNIDEYLVAVDSAKLAYEEIKDNEDVIVLLSNDEESANKLLELEDHIEASEVIRSINNLNNLTYDGGRNDSLNDIISIKTLYSNLTDEQKALVDNSNYEEFLNKINIYNNVDYVAYLIKSIPNATDSDEYYDAIDVAKAAYDNLTDEEKELLDTDFDFNYVRTLKDNEKASEVIKLISDINEISCGGDNDSLEVIEAAEEAYNSLTEEQKKLVDQANHDKLVDDRETYDNVSKTIELINSIGDISSGDADLEAIKAAREAYDNLTDEQKELINSYEGIVETLENTESIYEAMKAIDNILDDNFDENNVDSINNARAIYDSLTDEQKELLGEEYLNKLLKAEESYESNKNITTAIGASIVAASSISVSAGIAAISYIIKKKRIKIKH